MSPENIKAAGFVKKKIAHKISSISLSFFFSQTFNSAEKEEPHAEAVSSSMRDSSENTKGTLLTEWNYFCGSLLRRRILETGRLDTPDNLLPPPEVLLDNERDWLLTISQEFWFGVSSGWGRMRKSWPSPTSSAIWGFSIPRMITQRSVAGAPSLARPGLQ